MLSQRTLFMPPGGRSRWYPFRDLRPYSLYQRLYTVLNTRWDKDAFTRAKRVIAVARPLVHELVDMGVRAAVIDVVWNGVDTRQFRCWGGAPAVFWTLA